MTFFSFIQQLMCAIRQDINRTFTSRWVFAHLKGITLSLLGLIIIQASLEIQDSEYFVPFFGLVLGPLLGGAQWKVLREHFPAAHRWVLTSTIGACAGLTLTSVGAALVFKLIADQPNLLFVASFGAALGLGIGWCQSRSLKAYDIDRRAWVWSNVAGWSAGFATATACPLFLARSNSHDTRMIFLILLIGILAGAAVLAAITGKTLEKWSNKADRRGSSPTQPR